MGTTPVTFGRKAMAWIILLFAGLLEVVWAVGLKYTHGFTRLTPSIITIVAIIASMGLLAYAMRDLPAGTAYAIWTGIGAVGTAIVGIIFLGESANIFRLLSLGLIIIGLIGLKVSS
ncbi:multidrug resistance protein, SMR family [Providencia stuartii ATCC 25827]|nr:multidrug resistance protein, SMR family [Providencia stuartii ATCC 25827]